MADDPRGTPPPGIPVDAHGQVTVDPTKNVLDLVHAATTRQDDLMALQMKRLDDLRTMETGFTDKMNDLTRHYEEVLRVKEQERLDAIRAVDVQAVAVAQAAQQAAATALQQQVVATAEAARVANAAATVTNSSNLATLIEPLRTAIEDLRKTQYASASERSAQVESRGDTQAAQAAVVTTSVAQALLPMQTQIAQLLAAQSVRQGQQGQQADTSATTRWIIGLVVGGVFSMLAIAVTIILFIVLHG